MSILRSWKMLLSTTHKKRTLLSCNNQKSKNGTKKFSCFHTIFHFLLYWVGWALIHDLDSWDGKVSLVSVIAHLISILGILVLFIFFSCHYSILRNLFALQLILCIAVTLFSFPPLRCFWRFVHFSKVCVTKTKQKRSHSTFFFLSLSLTQREQIYRYPEKHFFCEIFKSLEFFSFPEFTVVCTPPNDDTFEFRLDL